MGRVILADDHRVVREGLKALVESQTSHQVVAQAENGLELAPMVNSFKPDIVVLDLAMPMLGGLESLNRIKDLDQRPSVLVLSSRDDRSSVREAIKAGASGYVTKSSSPEELLAAIEAIIKGEHYFSPDIAKHLVDLDSEEANPIYGKLSSREREVMKLLCEGLGNKFVADTLKLSTRTIDSHRANIMRKLGVQSNAELVQEALRWGLLEA
jgi:DNA-binding NarL/FixJ family response regulator